MANEHTSLATKYRPKDWDSVAGQTIVKQILKHQVDTGTFKQSYLLCGKWGSGKALTLDSRLLGNHGYFLMKDAAVGMQVYGEDGKLHTISGVYPQGQKECYRITFSDRSYIECCGDHLWNVCKLKDAKKVSSWDTQDTKWLLAQMSADSSVNYGIPVTAPLVFEDVRSSFLDAYLFGLLIASGALLTKIPEIQLRKEALVRDVENLLSAYKCVLTKVDDCIYSISSNDSSNVLAKLIGGVYDDDGIGTYIPEMYLFSSRSMRLQLLRGLIDGGGDSSHIKVNNCSKLVQDVIFLIQSLGGLVDLTEVLNGSLDSARVCKLKFRMSEPLLSYVTSVDWVPLNNEVFEQSTLHRAISKIECIEPRETQCIMTDNPSGLFLADNMIVTHNTTVARIMANAINGNSYDIVEIDAASNNGADQVRAISEDAHKRPLIGKYKIFIVDECFDGDVEVLTDSGFKKFKDLDKTEKIAQYTSKHTIEFVTPTRFIQRYHEGAMSRFTVSSGVSLLLTPNHIQPLYDAQQEVIKSNKIAETTFSDTTKLITSGQGVGNNSELTDFERLAIVSALIGEELSSNSKEGYTEWGVTLSDPDKILRLQWLLASIGVEWREDFVNCHLTRFVYNLPSRVSINLADYFSLDFSFGRARQFVEEVLKWVRVYISPSSTQFKCNNESNVDFISAVSILGGYGCRKVTCDYDFITGEPIYELCLTDMFIDSTECCEVEEVEYAGQVYCVEVPSHMIVVRYHGYAFVSGNCHLTSQAGWGCWLKLVEEPPASAIFIFATTDPQKIPNTILSRVQRYDFTNIPKDQIVDRLKYIATEEHIDIDDESLDYIAKAANGGMRDAIAMLDKCNSINDSIRMKQVTDTLALTDYDVHLSLLHALVNKNAEAAIKIISDVYYDGKDLKLFMNQFLTCVCDVCNYYVFNKSFRYISIPNIPDNVAKMAEISLDDCVPILDWCKDLNGEIRANNSPKNAILVEVMLWCKK